MLRVEKFTSHSNVIAFTTIFFLTLGVYWNSLHGDFIWDDRGLILNSTGYLGNWKNLFLVFTEPFFGKTPFYRPFLIISLILDYQLWDLHSFGFHFTNLLLHVLNAFLVYLLVGILFKHRGIAFCASLLFATHPIQTEAVAWISGRNDVLLAFFSLLALIFYLRGEGLTGIKRVGAFIGFMTSYGCVLLTKESGIVLPLLMVICDYSRPSNVPYPVSRRRKTYLTIIVVSLLYVYLRAHILHAVGVGRIGEDFIPRLLRVFIIYAYYFKMLLFPLHQTGNPFIPYFVSFKDPLFISSLISCTLVLFIITICWRHLREISFLILWMVITLLPVSGIIPLTDPALEHRAYFATLGFCTIIPLLIVKGLSKSTYGILFKRAHLLLLLGVGPLLIILIVYSAKTAVRNRVWRGESTFWLTTIEESPFSVAAHNNLGLVYVRQGQYRSAIEEFEKALSLNSVINAASIHQKLSEEGVIVNNLGRLYYQLLKEYQLVPEVHPESERDAIPLITTHGVEGIFQKSRDSFQKALLSNPTNAEAHHNLGDLYYLRGLRDLALKEYRCAIALNPFYAEAHNSLGVVYFDEKHYDDAQREFLKSVELKPDFGEACNNLALVYFNQGLYHKALEGFSHALKLMPRSAEVHFNLALVYLRGFQNKQKGGYFLVKSLELDPSHPRAVTIREILSQLNSGKVFNE